LEFVYYIIKNVLYINVELNTNGITSHASFNLK